MVLVCRKGLLMVISKIIWAAVIPLLCISLTICFRKYLISKYKNKNIDASQPTRLISLKTFLQACCFILPTISGVLIFNAFFLFCSKRLIMIESVMDYSDSFATGISLVATMSVAFFQYRIQENIEQEHNFQEQQSKEFQEDIRKIEKKYHIQELCSERLRSLKSLEGVKGKAINYAILESSCVHQDSPRPNERLFITIGDKSDISDCKFYHPFFSPYNTKEWSDYIYCNDVKMNVYEFSPYCLSFGIDIINSAIIDFVTYPAKKKCAQTQMNRPKLHCRFEPHVLDSSIDVIEDQKENLYAKTLTYRLEFDIEPLNFGYTSSGSFEVCATNARLTVITFPADY